MPLFCSSNATRPFSRLRTHVGALPLPRSIVDFRGGRKTTNGEDGREMKSTGQEVDWGIRRI